MSKSEQIGLGLAVLEYVARPGVCLTQQDIADVCGVSQSAIFQIEQKALRKLRREFQRQKNSEWTDSFRWMLERRAA